MGFLIACFLLLTTNLPWWTLIFGLLADLAWAGAAFTMNAYGVHRAREREQLEPLRKMVVSTKADQVHRKAGELVASTPQMAPIIGHLRDARIDELCAAALEDSLGKNRPDEVEKVTALWEKLRPDNKEVRARCQEARDKAIAANAKRGISDVF